MNKNSLEISNIKITPGAASIVLVMFIVSSMWLIFEYVEKERKRDIANWQSRLALVAEIRASAVEDWLSVRKNQLKELTGNASLRLFLSEYANRKNIDKSILNAQQGHVRNLLRASVSRFGFAVKNSNENQINLNSKSLYGLAIFSKDQQMIMSSKGFSTSLSHYETTMGEVDKTSEIKIIDVYSAGKNQSVYGFVAPVFQIQGLKSTTLTGFIVVLLDPEVSLYGLLKNRQNVTKSEETLLVNTLGPALRYVSPLSDGFKIFHQLPDNNNELASSFAYHNVGGFSEKTDYRGESVLVTGREIKNSPWRLVQKISSDEALEESNNHQQFLMVTFILLVLFMTAAFIAVWRHSTSLRLKKIGQVLETHTELLNAVTDNIQENIVLIDEDSKIIFINPVFAVALNRDINEIKGQRLDSVLGADTVNALKKIKQDEIASIVSVEVNQKKRIYHISSNRQSSGEHKGAILYVLHDISEIKYEQEKREQLGKGIISTLVKAVDMHDPFCANHSVRTREVAFEIGTAMGLSDEQLETLEMAALLANIGKLFVPKEILTKMQALSEDESLQLRKNIDYAVEILSELSFNGPVIEVIAQKNERLDGSGYPAGLKSDEILLEARILAVANAFVAMTSSRAYREGRTINEVENILLQQSISQYDRHVVAALFHIAENKADWEKWQNVQ